MASAGLKRPSDFELNSCWSTNKKRCTSFVMQPNMMCPPSPSSSTFTGQPNQANHHIYHPHHHHNQPTTSYASNLDSSPFKDPASILNSLTDDVITLIRNEVQKTHNHQHQQHQSQHNTQQNYHKSPQISANQYHPNQHTSSTSSSNPDGHESPVLTVRQTQTICEKLIREREHKLREEYDKILIAKLAEQYEQFVRYTQDHIEKRYNDPNSHHASYLS